MRKIGLAILLGLALFCVAYGLGWAGPFLVCDPYMAADGIIKFQVMIDAAAPVDSTPVANALKFDLSGVTTGVHTVKVKACNLWGCSSDSLPFSFTKSIPGVPTTISIANP